MLLRETPVKVACHDESVFCMVMASCLGTRRSLGCELGPRAVSMLWHFRGVRDSRVTFWKQCSPPEGIHYPRHLWWPSRCSRTSIPYRDLKFPTDRFENIRMVRASTLRTRRIHSSSSEIVSSIGLGLDATPSSAADGASHVDSTAA